ncbi:hypothetical protein EYF80_040725 [Liparis tanakae]|uniref:Uncharacterized protein n=1 Tax=Liparis tanakae TaxID=230148 RepID=A0A4Z2G673_9TELE|nr:hypothetical protein EYF80_040725 [Liparis tanakae]
MRLKRDVRYRDTGSLSVSDNSDSRGLFKAKRLLPDGTNSSTMQTANRSRTVASAGARSFKASSALEEGAGGRYFIPHTDRN